MLVAVENYNNGSPIGFVDLDARRQPGAEYTQCMRDSGDGLLCKIRENVTTPMPHLSDLVISPLHLRMGVGTALINVCVPFDLLAFFVNCKHADMGGDSRSYLAVVFPCQFVAVIILHRLPFIAPPSCCLDCKSYYIGV